MKNIAIVFIVLLLGGNIASFAQDGDKVVVKGYVNQEYRHTTSNGITKTDIEYRGKIVFNNTDTDVESISSGGFLKISKKTFGTRRSALLEGKSGGMVERSYRIGNKLQPWEPEGASWLADVLLEVIRSSGIGAETRVKRFYNSGRVHAVINEIDEILSDYVKSIYYSAAVNIPGVSTSDVNELIENASEEINSDYETSRFLIQNSNKFIGNESTVLKVFQSTAEISSDYEQSRVLLHYIKKEDLTDTLVGFVIMATADISSDFETSRVLMTLINENDLSEDQMVLLVKAINDMSSDYEKARVLLTAINEMELDDKSIGYIISVSDEISSDFEQVRVLTKLAGKPLNAENLELITEAIENVSSDFEKARLLKAIISKFDTEKDNIGFIIEATENISSDFEQARILTMISEKEDLSTNNFKAIIEAAENISSDYEKKRVLGTLIKNAHFDKLKALITIESIGKISSNYEKSNLLILLGPKLPDNDEVHDAFRQVAKSISSDFEYGKVMRSVDF